MINVILRPNENYWKTISKDQFGDLRLTYANHAEEEREMVTYLIVIIQWHYRKLM